MKLTKIAIVGLGSIGRRHLRLIKEIAPDIEVILVRSGKGQSWLEESMADHVVFSIQSAIKMNIQAAIISSPTTFHVEQAVQLVASGIHLLIEKPLSNSMDGVKELQKLALNNSCTILIGYALRFDLAARKFKQWLGDKQLGKFLHARIECGSYLPDWRPEQDYRTTVSASKKLGGGVLLELSHELDYLCWFFGKPISVYGQLRNSGELGIDVEDQVDLLMFSEKGFPMTVQIDFNRRRSTRVCNLQTTEGELTWDAIQKSVIWKSANDEKVEENFEFERDYIYIEQMKNFIRSIEKKSDPVVSLQDGINVMELIESVKISNRTGKKIIL